MATHSSILAWRILWTEESGGLQAIGSKRVGHDCATNMFTPPTPTPEVAHALNSGVGHSYQVFTKIGMGEGRDSHVQEKTNKQKIPTIF